MEKYYVITKTQKDAIMQYISEFASHRPFHEVSSALKMIASLPEAEMPNQSEEHTDA